MRILFVWARCRCVVEVSLILHPTVFQQVWQPRWYWYVPSGRRLLKIRHSSGNLGHFPSGAQTKAVTSILEDSFFHQNRLIIPICEKCRLVSYLDAFASVLSGQGYSRLTIKTKIRAISKLSQWLQKRHLVIEDLNESCINKFIRYRKKRNLLRSGDQFALKQFITSLREKDILSAYVPEIEVSEIQLVENSFAQHLQQERGLSQATIDNYLPTIRRFLTERFHKKKIIFEELYAHDISKSVLRYAHRLLRFGPNSRQEKYW